MTKLSRGSLIVRSSIVRTVYLFSSIVIAFFMMPFLVHSLGQRYYGMWTLVATIIGYYGYLDFGLSKAAQQFMARAIGRKDDAEVNRIVASAIAVFAVIGLMAFLVSLVIAALAPVFLDNAVEAGRFRIVITVLGLNVLLAFPMMAFNGLFSANFRFDVVVAIDLTKLIARNLLIFYFVSQGHSIVALAVITTAVDFVGHAARFLALRTLFPQVAVRRVNFERALVRPMFNYGGKAFLHSLADVLRFQVDSLVVTSFINLSAVTVYNIGGQLVNYFRQLMGSILGVIVPLYAQYDAVEDRDGMRRAFRLSSKVATILSVLLGGAALVFGDAFIEIWMGPEFAESYSVLAILVLGTVVHVSQEPAIALAYGTARHGAYARVALLEGVINAALSIVLVQVWGLRGVALGTTIPMLLSSLYILRYVTRFLECGFLAHAALQARIVLIGGLLHGGAWYLLTHFVVDSYLDLFLAAAVVVPVQSAILWMSGLDRDERITILSSVRGLLGGRGGA